MRYDLPAALQFLFLVRGAREAADRPSILILKKILLAPKMRWSAGLQPALRLPLNVSRYPDLVIRSLFFTADSACPLQAECNSALRPFSLAS